jgi:AMP nucleosidase
MKTKKEIVENWLPRYTGVALGDFSEYILLTNFSIYVELFAEKFGVKIQGKDKPMSSATANNITIINFGMGSAVAANNGFISGYSTKSSAIFRQMWWTKKESATG